MPVPFSVSVVLYNSAGERVRILYNGNASALPQDVKLNSQLLQIGVNQIDLNMGGVLDGGGTLVSWRGQNDNGQSVKGGTYYFKVEYHDQFGQTTSYVKSVQVIEGQGSNYLAVYNSAGEEVLRDDLSGYSHAIGDFSLDKDSLGVAFDANGVANDKITVTLLDSTGNTHSVQWDGRNSQGQPLSSGTYTMRLVNETSTGAVTTSRQVTLIKGADAGLPFDPFPAPNPAPSAGTPGHGRYLSVVYPSPGLSYARATLYNQVGEKVGAAGDPGNSGTIWLSYETLASGIYLVDVEGRLASGALYRRVLKVAILH